MSAGQKPDPPLNLGGDRLIFSFNVVLEGVVSPEVGPAAGSTADLVQAAGQAVSAALESAAGQAVSGLANLADRSTVDQA